MTTRNSAGFNTFLFSTTFLVGVGVLAFSASTAQAGCQINGTVVTCTDNEPNGFIAGVANLTVNVLDGATVNSNANGNGVDLLANSELNMYGNSSITANNYGAFFVGNNAVVTLNDAANISGMDTGIYILGNNAAITFNNDSSVQGIVNGIYIDGDNTTGVPTITLNGNSSVTAQTVGIYIDGTNHTVIVGSSASVTGSLGQAVALNLGSNTLTNHGTLTSLSTFAVIGDDSAGNFDTVNNFGTITGGGGIAIDLNSGNDILTLGTGSVINGTIDGGAGTSDAVILLGSGSEDDDFVNFENLQMEGADWSLSGTSNLGNGIVINHGRLAIDGNVSGNLTFVNVDGVLGGVGTLTSPVNGFGTIAPGNGVGTLNIVGDVTLAGQFGGGFEIEFDNSDLDLLDITGGDLTLLNSPVVNVIPLSGAGGAEGVIIQTDGGANNIINPIGQAIYHGNGAATLVQSTNDIYLVAYDGTGAVAGNVAGLRGGMDYLDAVAGAQLYDDTRDEGREGRVWGRGFGHFTAEDARDGNQAYNTRTAGGAVGGDFEVLEGLRLGLSGGYGATDAEVNKNAANTEIDGEYAALYARYELGGFFVSGVMSGGLQQVDIERSVASRTGRQEATAETDAVVYGGSLHAGYDVDFGEGFRLTPSAGVLYQHQTVDGYREEGANRGSVTMEDQKSESIRFTGQVNLAKEIDFEGFSLTPHISAGIANEITKGGKARGTFQDGTEFEVQLQEDNQVMGLAGAGLSIGFDTGLALSLDYQGRIAGDTTDHGIFGGVAFKW